MKQIHMSDPGPVVFFLLTEKWLCNIRQDQCFIWSKADLLESHQSGGCRLVQMISFLFFLHVGLHLDFL